MQIANHVGSALALTFATFYSLCSLLYVAWPRGFMAAAAMLFHGFSLSPVPHALSFGEFIIGVVCVAILGYLLGAVYAMISNALSTDRSAQSASRRAGR